MTEERRDWLQIAEAGSAFGIRFVVASMRILGRRGTGLILRIIALYYVILYARVRRCSRAYLSRVLDEPIRLRHIFRHVFTFARVTADRVLWITGNQHCFEIKQTGTEHLDEHARTKQGALLLSAHFGSGEAFAAAMPPDGLRVNVAGYFGQAALLHRLLGELSPTRNIHFLDLKRASLDSAMLVRERVVAGEVIVLAADRTGLGEREVSANFFGNRKGFPAGPFILASILHCPVYFVAAVYSEPGKYHLYCQRLTTGLHSTRGGRDAAIELLAQDYAIILEKHCHAAPYNWFNFYDVW